jgi:hypothetical protein
MSFYVGLDLGQSADHTALAVVEDTSTELHLRHLERYPLRTGYNVIADSVARLVRDPLLAKLQKRRPELIVDETGVGKAVVDMFRERRLHFRPVTITGGDVAREGAIKERGRSYRVPKRDLVGALEVPFHNGTLKVAGDLALWPTLRQELLSFRRKVSLQTGHDSYEHWRESDHDDLVLACALACWWARRVARLPKPTAIAAASPFTTRGEASTRPTDPPRYLGGEGSFAHGRKVEQGGTAGPVGGVRARPSGPLFRPEDFGM